MFECEVCSKSFGFVSQLEQHCGYTGHEGHKVVHYNHCCNVCERSFRTESALQQHQRDVGHQTKEEAPRGLTREGEEAPWVQTREEVEKTALTKRISELEKELSLEKQLRAGAEEIISVISSSCARRPKAAAQEAEALKREQQDQQEKTTKKAEKRLAKEAGELDDWVDLAEGNGDGDGKGY